MKLDGICSLLLLMGLICCAVSIMDLVTIQEAAKKYFPQANELTVRFRIWWFVDEIKDDHISWLSLRSSICFTLFSTCITTMLLRSDQQGGYVFGLLTLISLACVARQAWKYHFRRSRRSDHS
jgi:hypothetical protein